MNNPYGQLIHGIREVHMVELLIITGAREGIFHIRKHAL
jgi:hypothetical protein